MSATDTPILTQLRNHCAMLTHHQIARRGAQLLIAAISEIEKLERENAAQSEEIKQLKATLSAITPTLLKGRGCWTHEEIVAAVMANHNELAELRKDRERRAEK